MSREGSTRVPLMPSGARMWRAMYSAYGSPEAVSTMYPASDTATFEYFQSFSGAQTTPIFARTGSICSRVGKFFFFNDAPSTEIYTLSLHDAFPLPLIR